jgi:hypothetical protein
VHKESSSQQDWYTLGVYTDGAIGSTCNWTDILGVPHLQPLDYSTGGSGMHFYASKSFFDPVGGGGGLGRRIYWGWALVPPASAQTLPRDTRYHAALQRLTFQPIPELAALRASPPLFSGAGLALQANQTLWLGDFAPGAGNQSELSAVFELPSGGPALTFGVAVLVGAGGGGASGNLSTPVIFSFDPAAFTLDVTVGANATGGGGAFAAVPLLPGDARVDVRVFVDVTFVEVFCDAGPLRLHVRRKRGRRDCAGGRHDALRQRARRGLERRRVAPRLHLGRRADGGCGRGRQARRGVNKTKPHAGGRDGRAAATAVVRGRRAHSLCTSNDLWCKALRPQPQPSAPARQHCGRASSCAISSAESRSAMPAALMSSIMCSASMVRGLLLMPSAHWCASSTCAGDMP